MHTALKLANAQHTQTHIQAKLCSAMSLSWSQNNIQVAVIFVHLFFCVSFPAPLLYLPLFDYVVLLLSVFPVLIKPGFD